MTKAPRLTRLMLFGFLSFLPTSMASAQRAATTTINVIVRARVGGMRIQSEVARHQGTNQIRYPTLRDGTGIVDLGTCDGPVQLTVYPMRIGFSGDSEVVTCARRLVIFELERNERYPALAAAITDLQRQTFYHNAHITARRLALRALLERGSPAEAAGAANVMAFSYRVRDPQLAASYRALAIEAGQKALTGNAWADDVSYALVIDASETRLAMTREGVRQLIQFQRSSGIPVTGRWDPTTFQALRLAEQWPPIPND